MMQIKDIPTEPILKFLSEHQTEWCNWFDTSFDNSVIHAFPEEVRNTTLVLRKMQNLQDRGLVSGCDCGCRGDYVITDKGLEIIGAEAHPDRAYMY